MSNDVEQAVASYFRLSKALRKREKHKPGVDKIVDAWRARAAMQKDSD